MAHNLVRQIGIALYVPLGAEVLDEQVLSFDIS
jgi:hypothetical protein